MGQQPKTSDGVAVREYVVGSWMRATLLLTHLRVFVVIIVAVEGGAAARGHEAGSGRAEGAYENI
eukprot:4978910-Pyramimonas_sp.AAC.2